MKDCFSVIKTRYITEKSNTLAQLQHAESNASVRACRSPKAVFLVDDKASKTEIAVAVEQIYKKQGVKVVKVNTLRVKPKMTRGRGRGRTGNKPGFKKAIVTFQPGDSIDNV
jgi:large subunit ribosomal protein L23